LNNNVIQKFLKLDKELDGLEDEHVQAKLAKLESIRKNIKTTTPIGILMLIVRFEAYF
jgi:hypothetical protein